MGDVVSFKRESRFTFEPFAEIKPRSQPWRIKGVLPARGVAFLVGQSKAGKTFVGLDMTLKLAAGAPKVFGRRAHQCGVVYIAAEDPDGCRARVTAWRLKAHRTTAMPFELIGQGVNVLDAEDVADLRASLAEAKARFDAQGVELGVVAFDTLSRCIPGVDENSSMDMSRAFAALEQIGREIGVLVVVVAHFGKAGGDRGIRGWSGLDANSDATITVERDADDPHLRTLTFAKVKNGVDGGKLAFRLEEVGLGIHDEDGDEITSAVPVYEQAVEGAAKPRRRITLTPAEAVIFQAVKFVTDHGKSVTPPNVDGVRPYQRAVARDDVRERAFTSGFSTDDEKRNSRNVRFNRALEGLAGKRKVRIEGELLWLM